VSVEQIALIAPPADDVSLIGGWVQMLRAEVPSGLRAARALVHGRVPVKLFVHLDALDRDTKALVAAYRFQLCQDL
jgi:hypothetical protein